MTFSIVGRDLLTGSTGVAVATARPGVGAWSAFARTGTGACATQAIVNPGLAAAFLDGLEAGEDPDAALDAALAADPGAAHRQAAGIGTTGAAVARTGAEVSGWAGHLTGPDFAVAGNLLTGPGVVEAMADAFVSTPGDLAARLLAALVAGDRAGGDSRGRESAALLVVGTDPWPEVDLRIDHDPEPVARLAELLMLWRRHWQHYAETGTFVPADPPGRPLSGEATAR